MRIESERRFKARRWSIDSTGLVEAVRRVCREAVVPAAERCIAVLVGWSGARTPPSAPGSAPESVPVAADASDDARLTSRQREIARSLSGHNPELARWFTSAAALAYDRHPSAWPELVAHLGRDLMNRVPEYFDVPRPPRIEYPNLVGRLVSALGDDAELGSELVLDGRALEAVRELVDAQRTNTTRPGPAVLFAAAGRARSPLATHRMALDQAWTATQRGFVSSVHMRSVGKRPVAASEVLALFDRFEDLLAAQLGAVSFWSLEEELKEISAIADPTRSDLDRALVLARGEAINTFLGSLRSLAWLSPMRAARLFESPNPTEVLEDGSYRTPFWEPSRFLVRVAAEAPAEVTEMLLSLPETDNSRVHRDIIDAALAMPAEHAAPIASTVPSLLPGRYPMFASEPAADLAGKLVTHGHIDAGIGLARFLLTTEAFVAADRGFGADVGFRHVFDSDFTFAEAVSAVRAAVGEHAPLSGLRLFVEALARTLDDELHARGRSGPEELSYIWRKAIDDHAQNVHDGEVRDALIVAIRDLAVATISADPSRGPEVLTALAASAHLIFRRLALHVIRVCEFPSVGDLRRAAMLDREAFDDRRLHREMFLLQRERFGELSAVDREQIISWIEAGPDDDAAWRGAFEQFEGRPADDNDLALRTAGWRQRHWLALEPWLSAEQRGQLEALNAAHGVDDHPEFSTFVTADFRPIEMPYESDDLRAMSIPELLEVFTSWQPSGDGLAARPDALGMAVEQAVRDAPDHWAELARDLSAAPPRYRQFMLSGFAAATAIGRPFDLSAVLDLAAAHLEDGPPRITDDEPRRNGRRAIADLLRWVLVTGSASASELDESIWPLMQQLASDEAEAVDDTTDEIPSWSPSEHQLPLDTVRCLAYQAAIAYAGRIASAADSQREREVRGLIEAGLDPDREPSPAVRAKLASQLPELVKLNADWAARLLGPMLMGEPEHLVEVAWSAVLDLTPIPLEVVQVLLRAEAYEWALTHIGAETRFSQDRRERLGRHLLGAAVFDLEGFRTPWSLWHDLEDGEVRARVVETIGHELRSRGDQQGLAEALASRWRERLDALPDGDPELAGYGSWFAAGLLDPHAGADLLGETLRRSGGTIRSVRAVLEVAIAAVPSASLPIIEALTLIADGPTAGQLGWHHRLVRELIATLGATEEPSVLDSVEQLIEGLAERGLGDFRPTEGGLS